MSKFFVQLLLSVIVSVSAAVGFNPGAREKLKQTWHEAKAFVHEGTQNAFQTVSGVEINTGASADTSLESDLDADLSADADTEAQAELEAEAETELEADMESAALELESELESTVDLGLELGK